jgi:hypothetical protein
VFGCTLGNLMHYCRRPQKAKAKHHATRLAPDKATTPLLAAIGAMRRVLTPGGRAVAKATGPDVPHLVRGLACHRVLQTQGRRLRELKRAPAIDHRVAHVGIVVGISAAILVAYECMAMDPADCDGLDAQLVACLRDTQVALVGWSLPDIYDQAMFEARDAEVRALERARIGVARAQEAIGLEPPAAMRLVLDCYRRALWPAGEEIGPEGHGRLLKRIKTGELVDLERDAHVADAMAPPGIAPLAALSALPHASAEHDAAGAGSHGNPRDGWDSASCSNSGSSAWSFASSTGSAGSLQPFSLQPFDPFIAEAFIAAKFRAHALSLEALAAVSPRQTVVGYRSDDE